MTQKRDFMLLNKRSAFYTGGSVQPIGSSGHLVCQNGAVLSVLDVEEERLVKEIGRDDSKDDKDGTDPILCFSVSPDGSRVVAGFRSLLLKLYDIENNQCQRQWKGHTGPAASIAFDSTSTLVAIGFSDGLVRVWDSVQQYWTHHLRGSRGRVSLCCFHPITTRHILYTTADDYAVRAWDLKSSTCSCVFEAHSSPVTSICLSHTGNKLISSGRDKMIHIWNSRNGQLKQSVPVMEEVEACLILPHVDGMPMTKASCVTELQFVVCGENGRISIWQSDGKCLFSQQSTKDGAHITQLVSLLSHNKMVTVTFDHRILVWNLDFSLDKQFIGYSDEILDVAFLHNNYMVVASNSNHVRLSSLDSLASRLLTGHTDTILALNVSKDGSLIVTCSKDNTVRVWKGDQANHFCCVGVGVGHTQPVGSVCLSQSSRFLVSGSEDCTLKLWNVKDHLKALEGPQSKLPCILTQKAHDKPINSVAVSPNDKLIATGSQDRTAKVWNVDGSLISTLWGHKRGVWSVCFSPVDKCLATSSGDTTIKIWSLSDGLCVKTLEGHVQSVLRVLFVSTGMQLISCGSDGLVKLWSVKDNECVATLDQHTDKVWALAVSQDEQFVVSGGADSLLVIWKDSTEESEEKRRMELETLLRQEQELANLLQQKQYSQAVMLSLSLSQPQRLLSVVSSIFDNRYGVKELSGIVRSMTTDQLDELLSYIVTWNTNSRSSLVSQSLLNIILSQCNPDKLMELPTMKANLEALLPYSERHMSRSSRLLQQSMFVDYTWQRMRGGIMDHVDNGFDNGFIDAEQNEELQQDCREEEKMDVASTSKEDKEEVLHGDSEILEMNGERIKGGVFQSVNEIPEVNGKEVCEPDGRKQKEKKGKNSAAAVVLSPKKLRRTRCTSEQKERKTRRATMTGGISSPVSSKKLSRTQIFSTQKERKIRRLTVGGLTTSAGSLSKKFRKKQTFTSHV
jgi:U3 small nucleolar RNA-associated protein 13